MSRFLFNMSTWIELKNNPRLREIYETRLRVVGLVREWFIINDFLEADTPVALRLPGQEPYLNPVEVDFNEPNGRSEKFYLQTSPEFSLKKLLAAGFNNIFEIAKCFRNSESFGGTHNTEFTMLEWYRAPGSLDNMMDDTENVFKYVGEKLGTSQLIYKDKVCPLNIEWERKSMKALWQEFLNVDLDEYLEIKKMRELAVKLDCGLEDGAAYEDYFYKIFLNKIEGNLGMDKPLFVYDYPAQMCSLSRPSNDPNYAQRFELYINGLELANAFGELVDGDLQMINLQKDMELRAKLSRPTWAVDPDFISALKSGVPGDCAGGNSVGLDRLVMLFTGAKDINEVIFQSVADQLSF